jgi:MOSC domain-containing protein YiiM
MPASILGLASDSEHRFAKQPRQSMKLVAGRGVEGDAHCGEAVQHRSRIARDPAALNLRQVHLIQSELFEELAAMGFPISPGQLGENVTSRGIDLLALSRGTRLRLGNKTLIEITGLRNPCRQIDDNIGKGAMAALLDRVGNGSLVRKAGVMAVVLESGVVNLGDGIRVEWQPAAPIPLEPV